MSRVLQASKIQKRAESFLLIKRAAAANVQVIADGVIAVNGKANAQDRPSKASLTASDASATFAVVRRGRDTQRGRDTFRGRYCTKDRVAAEEVDDEKTFYDFAGTPCGDSFNVASGDSSRSPALGACLSVRVPT